MDYEKELLKTIRGKFSKPRLVTYADLEDASSIGSTLHTWLKYLRRCYDTAVINQDKADADYYMHLIIQLATLDNLHEYMS